MLMKSLLALAVSITCSCQPAFAAQRPDKHPPEFISLSPSTYSQVTDAGKIHIVLDDNVMLTKLEAVVNDEHTVVLWKGPSQHLIIDIDIYDLGMTIGDINEVDFIAYDFAGNKKVLSVVYFY